MIGLGPRQPARHGLSGFRFLMTANGRRVEIWSVRVVPFPNESCHWREALAYDADTCNFRLDGTAVRSRRSGRAVVGKYGLKPEAASAPIIQKDI